MLILCVQSEPACRGRTPAIHGYDATSLNLLLKELEISKGQFYYWFEDKADLFFTVMKEGLDALRLRLDEHGQPTSPTDYWVHMRESRLITERFWDDNDFVEIGQMVSQQIPSNHPIYERLVVCSAPLQSHFREGLRLGQEWGLVPPRETAASPPWPTGVQRSDG